MIRLTGGRSYSEPDPSLLAFAPPIYGAPSSINCPPATSGTGALVSIASVANPTLQPETAGDLELAYGHRFNATTNIQADVYQSLESQALLNGNVSIVGFPGITVPSELHRQSARAPQLVPGPQPDDSQSRLHDDVQRGGGALSRYRAFDQRRHDAATSRSTRRSTSNRRPISAYRQDILIGNTNLLDGGQIYGIPLRQGTAGLAYQDNQGFGARLDATYIGGNNSWNRNPFWFANASVSKTSGQVGINFGIYNLFNSVAQQYGFIGSGVYVPQNFYGLAQNGGADQRTRAEQRTVWAPVPELLVHREVRDLAEGCDRRVAAAAASDRFGPRGARRRLSNRKPA